MKSSLQRWLLLLLCLVPGALWAEHVADLPMPSRYVNDFAGVLSPAAVQTMEDECRQLHSLANSDVAVVTIKQLEDGQSIEEFTVALEEKWKLGKKGSDRSAIYVLVLNPHRLRIEVGYGLEGILNDAKVGAILDQATPFAKTGDYDRTMETGLDGVAQVIATDAHVTLTSTVHHYRRVPAAGPTGPQRLGLGGYLIGAIVLGAVLLMIFTGNGGLLFSLLFSLMGSGGGGGGGFGGGGRDDDSGGSFGGSGGGESGGGGASRDF